MRRLLAALALPAVSEAAGGCGLWDDYGTGPEPEGEGCRRTLFAPDGWVCGGGARGDPCVLVLPRNGSRRSPAESCAVYGSIPLWLSSSAETAAVAAALRSLPLSSEEQVTDFCLPLVVVCTMHHGLTAVWADTALGGVAALPQWHPDKKLLGTGLGRRVLRLPPVAPGLQLDTAHFAAGDLGQVECHTACRLPPAHPGLSGVRGQHAAGNGSHVVAFKDDASRAPPRPRPAADTANQHQQSVLQRPASRRARPQNLPDEHVMRNWLRGTVEHKLIITGEVVSDADDERRQLAAAALQGPSNGSEALLAPLRREMAVHENLTVVVQRVQVHQAPHPLKFGLQCLVVPRDDADAVFRDAASLGENALLKWGNEKALRDVTLRTLPTFRGLSGVERDKGLPDTYECSSTALPNGICLNRKRRWVRYRYMRLTLSNPSCNDDFGPIHLRSGAKAFNDILTPDQCWQNATLTYRGPRCPEETSSKCLPACDQVGHKDECKKNNCENLFMNGPSSPTGILLNNDLCCEVKGGKTSGWWKSDCSEGRMKDCWADKDKMDCACARDRLKWKRNCLPMLFEFSDGVPKDADQREPGVHLAIYRYRKHETLKWMLEGSEDGQVWRELDSGNKLTPLEGDKWEAELLDIRKLDERIQVWTKDGDPGGIQPSARLRYCKTPDLPGSAGGPCVPSGSPKKHLAYIPKCIQVHPTGTTGGDPYRASYAVGRRTDFSVSLFFRLRVWGARTDQPPDPLFNQGWFSSDPVEPQQSIVGHCMQLKNKLNTPSFECNKLGNWALFFLGNDRRLGLRFAKRNLFHSMTLQMDKWYYVAVSVERTLGVAFFLAEADTFNATSARYWIPDRTDWDDLQDDAPTGLTKDSLEIGCDLAGFDLSVAQVAFWRRSLTSDEVQRLYDNGIKGDPEKAFDDDDLPEFPAGQPSRVRNVLWYGGERGDVVQAHPGFEELIKQVTTPADVLGVDWSDSGSASFSRQADATDTWLVKTHTTPPASPLTVEHSFDASLVPYAVVLDLAAEEDPFGASANGVIPFGRLFTPAPRAPPTPVGPAPVTPPAPVPPVPPTKYPSASPVRSPTEMPTSPFTEAPFSARTDTRTPTTPIRLRLYSAANPDKYRDVVPTGQVFLNRSWHMLHLAPRASDGTWTAVVPGGTENIKPFAVGGIGVWQTLDYKHGDWKTGGIGQQVTGISMYGSRSAAVNLATSVDEGRGLAFEGLILWWTLDDNAQKIAGARIADRSAGRQHGTLSGINWRTGADCGASASTQDGCAQLGASSSIHTSLYGIPEQRLTGLTVSMRLKPTAAGRLVSFGSPESLDILLSSDTAGGFVIIVRLGAMTMQSATALAAADWHHVAVTVCTHGEFAGPAGLSTSAWQDNNWPWRVNSTDGGAAFIYVDGTLVANARLFVPALIPVHHFTVGGLRSGAGGFEGTVDDIIVHSFCLAGGQVKDLSQGGTRSAESVVSPWNPWFQTTSGDVPYAASDGPLDTVELTSGAYVPKKTLPQGYKRSQCTRGSGRGMFPGDCSFNWCLDGRVGSAARTDCGIAQSVGQFFDPWVDEGFNNTSNFIQPTSSKVIPKYGGAVAYASFAVQSPVDQDLELHVVGVQVYAVWVNGVYSASDTAQSADYGPGKCPPWHLQRQTRSPTGPPANPSPPTRSPDSASPSRSPTKMATVGPTPYPAYVPLTPSASPNNSSAAPTVAPSLTPTAAPSQSPSMSPPSSAPSPSPTHGPKTIPECWKAGSYSSNKALVKLAKGWNTLIFKVAARGDTRQQPPLRPAFSLEVVPKSSAVKWSYVRGMGQRIDFTSVGVNLLIADPGSGFDAKGITDSAGNRVYRAMQGVHDGVADIGSQDDSPPCGGSINRVGENVWAWWDRTQKQRKDKWITFDLKGEARVPVYFGYDCRTDCVGRADFSPSKCDVGVQLKVKADQKPDAVYLSPGTASTKIAVTLEPTHLAGVAYGVSIGIGHEPPVLQDSRTPHVMPNDRAVGGGPLELFAQTESFEILLELRGGREEPGTPWRYQVDYDRDGVEPYYGQTGPEVECSVIDYSPRNPSDPDDRPTTWDDVVVESPLAKQSPLRAPKTQFFTYIDSSAWPTKPTWALYSGWRLAWSTQHNNTGIKKKPTGLWFTRECKNCSITCGLTKSWTRYGRSWPVRNVTFDLVVSVHCSRLYNARWDNMDNTGLYLPEVARWDQRIDICGDEYLLELGGVHHGDCVCGGHGTCHRNGGCVCHSGTALRSSSMHPKGSTVSRYGHWDPQRNCFDCLEGYWGPLCRETCPGMTACPSGGGAQRVQCRDPDGVAGPAVCSRSTLVGAGNVIDHQGGACKIQQSIRGSAVWTTASGRRPCQVCYGHGHCGQKDRLRRYSDGQCRCDQNWDPGTNCANCIRGFYGGNCALTCPKKNDTDICDGQRCNDGTLGDGTCSCKDPDAVQTDAGGGFVDCSCERGLGLTADGFCMTHLSHTTKTCAGVDCCPDGTWGTNCAQLCCSGHGRCIRETGTSCTCHNDASTPGLGFWTVEVCDMCAEGYIGPNCSIHNLVPSRMPDLTFESSPTLELWQPIRTSGNETRRFPKSPHPRDHDGSIAADLAVDPADPYGMVVLGGAPLAGGVLQHFHPGGDVENRGYVRTSCPSCTDQRKSLRIESDSLPCPSCWTRFASEEALCGTYTERGGKETVTREEYEAVACRLTCPRPGSYPGGTVRCDIFIAGEQCKAAARWIYVARRSRNALILMHSDGVSLEELKAANRTGCPTSTTYELWQCRHWSNPDMRLAHAATRLNSTGMPAPQQVLGRSPTDCVRVRTWQPSLDGQFVSAAAIEDEYDHLVAVLTFTDSKLYAVNISLPEPPGAPVAQQNPFGTSWLRPAPLQVWSIAAVDGVFYVAGRRTDGFWDVWHYRAGHQLAPSGDQTKLTLEPALLTNRMDSRGPGWRGALLGTECNSSTTGRPWCKHLGLPLSDQPHGAIRCIAASPLSGVVAAVPRPRKVGDPGVTLLRRRPDGTFDALVVALSAEGAAEGEALGDADAIAIDDAAGMGYLSTGVVWEHSGANAAVDSTPSRVIRFTVPVDAEMQIHGVLPLRVLKSSIRAAERITALSVDSAHGTLWGLPGNSPSPFAVALLTYGVYKVEPAYADAIGGTVLTILGWGFTKINISSSTEHSSALCRFRAPGIADNHTEGNVQQPDRLYCITPPALAGGGCERSQVYVSMSGPGRGTAAEPDYSKQRWTRESAALRHVQPPAITAVHPASIPVDHESVVTIRGCNFEPIENNETGHLSCVFYFNRSEAWDRAWDRIPVQCPLESYPPLAYRQCYRGEDPPTRNRPCGAVCPYPAHCQRAGAGMQTWEHCCADGSHHLFSTRAFYRSLGGRDGRGEVFCHFNPICWPPGHGWVDVTVDGTVYSGDPAPLTLTDPPSQLQRGGRAGKPGGDLFVTVPATNRQAGRPSEAILPLLPFEVGDAWGFALGPAADDLVFRGALSASIAEHSDDGSARMRYSPGIGAAQRRDSGSLSDCSREPVPGPDSWSCSVTDDSLAVAIIGGRAVWCGDMLALPPLPEGLYNFTVSAPPLAALNISRLVVKVIQGDPAGIWLDSQPSEYVFSEGGVLPKQPVVTVRDRAFNLIEDFDTLVGLDVSARLVECHGYSEYSNGSCEGGAECCGAGSRWADLADAVQLGELLLARYSDSGTWERVSLHDAHAVARLPNGEELGSSFHVPDAHPGAAIDGDPHTSWICLGAPLGNGAPMPTLEIRFAQPTAVHSYAMVLGDWVSKRQHLEQGDPVRWILEASARAEGESDWVTLSSCNATKRHQRGPTLVERAQQMKYHRYKGESGDSYQPETLSCGAPHWPPEATDSMCSCTAQTLPGALCPANSCGTGVKWYNTAPTNWNSTKGWLRLRFTPTALYGHVAGDNGGTRFHPQDVLYRGRQGSPAEKGGRISFDALYIDPALHGLAYRVVFTAATGALLGWNDSEGNVRDGSNSSRLIRAPPCNAIMGQCSQPASCYRIRGSTACARCPANAVCDGTTAVNASRGAWRGTNLTVAFLRCPSGDACPYSLNGAGDELCAANHSGPLCQTCAPGYGGGVGAGTCSPCPSPVLVGFRIAAGTIISVCGVGMWAAAVLAVNGAYPFLVILQITINHLQTLYLLSTMNVPFPQGVEDFFRNLEAFAFRFEGFQAFRCAITQRGWSYLQFSGVYMMSPLAAIPVGVVAFFAYRTWEKYRSRRYAGFQGLAEADAWQDAAPYADLRGIAFRAHANQRATGWLSEVTRRWGADAQLRRPGWHAGLTALLLTLYLSYMALTHTIARLMVCVSFESVWPCDTSTLADEVIRRFPDGCVPGGIQERRLAADHSVRCDSASYRTYRSFGILCMVLYTIGLPLGFAAAIHVMSRRVGDSRTHWILCALVGGMRRKCWFWCSVIMGRKAVLVFVATFISHRAVQGYVAMWVMTAALVLQLGLRPYAMRDHNIAEAVGLGVMVFQTNAACLLTYIDREGLLEAARDPAGFCIVAFSIIIFLCLLVVALVHLPFTAAIMARMLGLLRSKKETRSREEGELDRRAPPMEVPEWATVLRPPDSGKPPAAASLGPSRSAESPSAADEQSDDRDLPPMPPPTHMRLACGDVDSDRDIILRAQRHPPALFIEGSDGGKLQLPPIDASQIKEVLWTEGGRQLELRLHQHEGRLVLKSVRGAAACAAWRDWIRAAAREEAEPAAPATARLDRGPSLGGGGRKGVSFEAPQPTGGAALLASPLRPVPSSGRRSAPRPPDVEL
eukprot:TRINITY_DN13654_c0_g1_i2.p1 TRINITY_DN13654_c0_g1~~TRINITY_DN13654_c0_g1_i2.p1  ORF type:complete len:4766 (+),score=280.07 TRINITY_DN13654_c0_g1_i2:80-14299(+)